MERIRTETLYRRSVHLINQYLEPRDIYKLIVSKSWDYSEPYVDEYVLRDRAMMAMVYCSAGRIAEVVGGPAFKLSPRYCKICGEELTRNVLEKKPVFSCPTHGEQSEYNRKAVKVGNHPGLRVENITFLPQYIKINGMRVVKRSQRLITKYGEQIRLRDEFVIPLQRQLFTNQYWDQLTPFGVLIKKYLETYPPKGKLFGYASSMAYKIIRYVTGYHPHWFRAQAEHFYGHFLLPDTIKLSKFVKIQDPNQVKSYIGYSWTEQLKDTTMSMDFDWIDSLVA